MSGQSIEADSALLRTSATTLTGVAEELREAHRIAADAIAKIASAAGQDKFGEAFRFGSNGQPGFDEGSTNVLANTETTAENLDLAGGGLTDTASAVDEMEVTNTDDLITHANTSAVAGGGPSGSGSTGSAMSATRSVESPVRKVADPSTESTASTTEPTPEQSGDTSQTVSALASLASQSISGIAGATTGIGELIATLSEQAAAEQAAPAEGEPTTDPNSV
ncbi:hypothetical protein ACFVMC_01965 [Nocardia sp. NPDC127579]|uniref:hypothetical protein n=1 Tax=Nocardia sp. NPDC127579 TaxID=3345402 RepID=UPI00362FB22D